MSSAGYWIVSIIFRKSASSASVPAEQKAWTVALPEGCLAMASVVDRPEAVQVCQVTAVLKSLPGEALTLALSIRWSVNW